jgi:biopolymer transport protein ExbB
MISISIATANLAEQATALSEEVAGEMGGQGLFGLFFKGGGFMWPILIASIVALAFVFERFVSLRRNAIYPKRDAEQLASLVDAGKLDEAMVYCDAHPTPFSRVLHACIMRADSAGFEMEAALEESGARVLYDLRRGCRPLGIIAELSPLLGLLGTVTGMIEAFDVVAQENALGQAELLAGGISKALLTTAFGLCVAVPALLFYQYFRSRSEGWVRIIEDSCIERLVALRKRSRRAAPPPVAT